jgi:hypothetical protein
MLRGRACVPPIGVTPLSTDSDSFAVIVWTVSMAVSTATPQVSPSPCRAWPPPKV